MHRLTAEKLIRAGRCIEPPFSLMVTLSDSQVELKFSKILRLLPGKRIVGVATANGSQFLIKAYLGRAASRYAMRERNGVGLLALTGVRTPKLHWHARLSDGKGEVLAFEYLTDAVSLFDRWREAHKEDERVDVLTRAMVIIGKLHNQGVVQNDIHLANFLLAGGKLYTIDGGDVVKRSKPPLAEKASLSNLGMFFAQFYPKFDELMHVVLPAYEAVRQWEMNSLRVTRLEAAIAINRDRRKKAYINKAFRDCTRFVCNKSVDRFEVCDRSYYSGEMAELMASPDEMIASGTLLKDGGSSTVALVQLSDRALVIKRYNLKSWWHRVRRAIRCSRAWTSWGNACRMEFLGIPSVKPIALIEHRFGPFRGTAYFITEYIEGQDALKCLQGLKHTNGELEALTSILRGLSESHISHGDLKATNFVMSNQGPVILDLDAMVEHRSKESFKRAFDRDIDRFMQNWQDRPELSRQFAGLLVNLTR